MANQPGAERTLELALNASWAKLKGSGLELCGGICPRVRIGEAESHRKRIRSTNLLERLFGEGRRRSKVIPRFINEKSGLSLMFAVLVDASANWRGVKITSAVSRPLEDLRKEL